jgi:hypothetical protein
MDLPFRQTPSTMEFGLAGFPEERNSMKHKIRQEELAAAGSRGSETSTIRPLERVQPSLTDSVIARSCLHLQTEFSALSVLIFSRI